MSIQDIVCVSKYNYRQEDLPPSPMHRITLSETPKNFPCGRYLLFSTKMRGISSIVPELRCIDKMALTFHPQGVLGLLLLLHREGSLYPNARLQTLLM